MKSHRCHPWIDLDTPINILHLYLFSKEPTIVGYRRSRSLKRRYGPRVPMIERFLCRTSCELAVSKKLSSSAVEGRAVLAECEFDPLA